MTTTIQTKRLTLRSLEAADAEVLFKSYQVEGVLQYFPPTAAPTLERVQRYIEKQQDHWGKHGYGHWGIVPKGEKQIIGWAGLQFLPELNETEVGYFLDKSQWNKGFATEAANASIQFGFDKYNLDHIIALVHPENIASRHVIDKCQFVYVETIHLWEINLMRHIRTNTI